VTALAPGLAGGVLLGLAASLHCIGMCGPVSGAMLMALPPGTPRGPAALAASLGRIATYAMLGGIAGGVGAPAFGALGGTLANALLHWAGVGVLAWTGLAMLGLTPPLRLLDAALAPVAGRAGHLAAAGARQMPVMAPALMGVAWGLMPCAMVHSALFYALVTGSAAGGIAAMAGFGLGTLPAVLAAGLAADRLRAVRRSAWAPRAAGAALLAFAALAALADVPGSPFCLTR
jgi:sulfite exporter TauE/SafE